MKAGLFYRLSCFVFPYQRIETDKRKDDDDDTKDHQVDIPLGDRRDLDPQRIVVGKEEVRPEIDVHQFAVKISR